MKRFLFIFILVVGALLVAVFNRPDTEREATVTSERSDSAQATRPNKKDDRGVPDEQVDRVIGGVSGQGQLIHGDPSEQADLIAKDGFVREVMSETWIDLADKAGRRRVRIVKADFKYPHIKLEERVWTDPGTGEQRVERIHASVADHLMLGLKEGVDDAAACKALVKHGYRVRATEPGSYILAEIADFDAEASHARSIADLEALNEFIDFAEPDYLVYPSVIPNDPHFGSKMWGLNNPGSVAGTEADADIDAPEAWDTRNDASGVVVAVTDTGIRYTHEDLAANMWQHPDTNVFGYDSYDLDDDPMDTNGHGTHCAGTIGAKGNNGKGITGVAWNVQLMALRFLGPYGGTTSDAIVVINYARLNGANVISASWGGGGFSKSLKSAIMACYEANIPFVAAAGNNSTNTDATPHYPSSYDVPNIVSVASTDSADELSYFSNYGAINVDIAAPGGDIWSCGISSDTDYQYLSGTSMAAPHVAGALALAKAQFPDESCEDHITRIYTSADPVSSLAGKLFTGGRLNLKRLYTNSTPAVYHDDFAKPLWFRGYYGYWCGSNARMTREDDEDDFSPDTGQKSLWFAWEAPTSGLLRFKGVAMKEDVSVVAFEGDDRTELKRVADNFDERVSKESYLYFYVEEGKTYRFSVDSKSSVHQVIIAELVLRPDNDMFLDARELASDDQFYDEVVSSGATAEEFEATAPHASVGIGKSVWWKWTASFTEEFTITTSGSEFDTVLAVYKGPNSNQLTEVASNDDGSGLDWTSKVTFNAVSGTEYYIAVDGFWGEAAGKIHLSGYQNGATVIHKQPADVDVVLGGYAEFSVLADSNQALQYQWYGPAGQISGGGRQSTFRIANVNQADFGTYYVKVFDGESVLESSRVELSELLIAPIFEYQPKDMTMLTGSQLDMQVKVTGTQPISLQWYKDGVAIPSATGSSFSLHDLALSDAGRYFVVATSRAGETQCQPFRVQVIQSPWSKWSWRHPLPAGSQVLGVKFLNGKHFAFGENGLIMISENGKDWEIPFVGKPIEFVDAVYENGRYIAAGRYSDDGIGSYLSAVSTDGVNWQIGSAMDLAVEKLCAGGGVLVAYDALSERPVLRSIDGLHWTSHQYQDPSGGTSGMRLISIAYNQGKFVAAGAYPDQNSIYTSTDGMSWTKHTRTFGGGIYRLGNRFVSYSGSPFQASFSDDGISWSPLQDCSNPPNVSNYSQLQIDDSVISHVSGNVTRFTTDGINWSVNQFLSEDSTYRYVSVGNSNVVVSGGRVLAYGSNFKSLSELTYDQPTPSLDRLANLNGMLWGMSALQFQSSTIDNAYVIYSSDGVEWNNGYVHGARFDPESLIWDGNHYWAVNGSIGGKIIRGHIPMNMLQYHTSGGDDIYRLASYNGSLFGCSKVAIFKLEAGEQWIAKQGIPVGQNFKSIQSTSMGLVALSSDGEIYLSQDGETWHLGSGRGFGPPSYATTEVAICEFDSKTWVLKEDSDRIYYSSNGLDFTEVVLPRAATDLVELPGGLAVIAGQLGMYSEDGMAWAEFDLPGAGYSFATLRGTLLAYSHQSILQTGQLSSQAPVCTLEDLGNTMELPRYSNFRFEASAVDPEGDLDRIEFWLNGKLETTSTSDRDMFTVVCDTLGLNLLEIRAYDGDGNMGRVYTHILVTSDVATPIMGYATPSGPDHFKVTQWAGGVVAVSSQGMFTSSDGFNWLDRGSPLRGLSKGIATGNGKIVMLEDRSSTTLPNLWLSSDGVGWERKDVAVDQIHFQNGWFVAESFFNKRYTSGSTSQLAFSQDGENWRHSSPSNGEVTDIAVGNGVFMAVIGGWIYYSVDGQVWSIQGALADAKSLEYHGTQFFAIAGDAVYTSDDGVDWTPVTGMTLNSGETLTALHSAGGVIFVESSQPEAGLTWFYDESQTWQEISSPVPKPIRIVFSESKWFCQSAEGVYTSNNALDWSKKLDVSELSSLPSFELNEDMKFMAHDFGVTLGIYGEIWTSEKGDIWTKVNQVNQTSETTETTVSLDGDDFYFQYLPGELALSNNGSDWEIRPVPVNSNESAFSVIYYQGGFLGYVGTSGWGDKTGFLLSSSDGENWSRSPASDGIVIVQVAQADNLLLARGWTYSPYTDGYYVSSDGVNWTPTTLPSTYEPPIVVNNEFVLIEPKKRVGSETIQTIHRSSDGVTWESITIPDGRIQALAYGNNRYVGTSASKIWVGTSLDSLVPYDTGISYLTADTIFADNRFITASEDEVHISVDGITWELAHTNFPRFIREINGEAFSRENGGFYRVLDAELRLDRMQLNSVDVGVGDAIPAGLVVSNVGYRAIPQNKQVTVQGVLSRDGVLGNGDDILLDRFDVVIDSTMDPGSENILNVQFTVPELSAGGEFHLAVYLDIDKGDSTSLNNVAITASSVVSVSEWQLTAVANGNGLIDQDFAALRYPHQSRISLTANAGKGAVFSGWGGDALGAESQITILMDGDKSLQANFSGRATLQVHVRGAGEVSGLADSGSYPVGGTATLTAVPAVGWQFAGWSGAASGTNTTASITMDEPKAVTAMFTLSITSWKSEHFSEVELLDPAISGDDADPDRDGLKNWQEYLHGSDPRSAASKGVVSLKVEGGYLYAVFTRNSGATGGLALACQGSRDLSDWDIPDLQERVLRTDNGIETIEARIPTSGQEMGFLRMRYQK